MTVASVGPDFGAVGGSDQLRAIVGALLTYGLILSVLMVVTCGATWGCCMKPLSPLHAAAPSLLVQPMLP